MFRKKKDKKKIKNIVIDLQNLAKGVTTGYARRGQAVRYSKGKKALKFLTIGLPIFFTRYLFLRSVLKKFPYFIQFQQQEKRRMKGKKSKKMLKLKKKKKK